jgi:hypothetical protein
MTNPAPQLAQKLWNSCNILRDDGMFLGVAAELELFGAGQGITRESLFKGLSVFEHHLSRFSSFKSLKAGDVPAYVMDAILVGVYVEKHFTEAERLRFFPVKLNK